MAKFKVKEEGRIKYQMTTWQGEVEFEDETIAFRYSEDDNGADLYILTENGWDNNIDMSENKNYAAIYAAINEWGNPEEFGSVGEECEIDDEIVEDYI